MALNNLVEKISDYVNNNTIFKTIKTDVEVMEIKEYPQMIFLKVCDMNQQFMIRAIIYKYAYTTAVSSGDKLKIGGYLKFYKNEVELIIRSYTIDGTGSQSKSLTKLKSELDRLGYFSNKKEILQNYHKIGIISSWNAAGLKDFLHTINSRCSGKKIYLYEAMVQGQTAPTEISHSIKLANQQNLVQILVIIRGGGSKEDLSSFDDKSLAKAIFESDLPIVTGIGHQIDISIADLVADKNFITPTAAAQSITTENITTENKIKEQIVILTSLLSFKINSVFDYIVNTDAKIRKYKSKFDEKIFILRNSHQAKLSEIQHDIKSMYLSQYAYLTYVTDQILSFKTCITKTYTDLLQTYQQTLSFNKIIIKKKLAEYDDCIKRLAQPKIICTTNLEEVQTLADFKLHRNYQIQFIDGSYDIKITHL